MKEVAQKLLSELMKNSRRSDRDLAKTIRTSQPTVTRIRNRLEKEGVIKDYSMIPDLNKLGIEILAFTFARWSPEVLKDYPQDTWVEKAQKFLSKHPNVIFASSGRGFGMERTMVSFHKNYSDYDAFAKSLEREWAGQLANVEFFVVSLKTDAVLRTFSFKNLGEYTRNTETVETE
jgi:DNA-binding Lrp family transcriptional regulator